MYKFVVLTNEEGDEEVKENINSLQCIDTMIFKENRY